MSFSFKFYGFHWPLKYKSHFFLKIKWNRSSSVMLLLLLLILWASPWNLPSSPLLELRLCILQSIRVFIYVSFSRMKFWKQLLWNMAKTSGLELPRYCTGNQPSSAKPDGKWRGAVPGNTTFIVSGHLGKMLLLTSFMFTEQQLLTLFNFIVETSNSYCLKVVDQK